MSKRVARERAARAARERMARQRRRRRTVWGSVAAVSALVLAGVVGWVVVSAQKPADGFPVPATATTDRTGLTVGSGPTKVEIYLDYLCPACRAFEQDAAATIERLVADQRITVVYHPVAILDRYSTNGYSSRSAAGAGCAADAGKLSEYTKALYGNQPAEGGAGHTDDQLIDLAAGAGVPREPFGQCLRDRRYADFVAGVTDAMAARGVNGTPTVFVNGRQLPNPSATTLEAAVQQP
ncbi:DsbA family protein [Rhizomonospora bruguierae]|uniref:DsbA family protein n=1 Tax=Rhizomonospora bruguierae TaxID=1581705 RepID=UPI001BD0F1B9|nr:thioredoxin domain-containing protein [Micromonospora sp. NBRC 107566]